MPKLNEESVVLIEMPKLVVRTHNVSKYLSLIDNFANAIRGYSVDELRKEGYTLSYNNVYNYSKSEFIPTVYYNSSYTDILNSYIPKVTQLDKFVDLDEPVLLKDQQVISEVWHSLDLEESTTELEEE